MRRVLWPLGYVIGMVRRRMALHQRLRYDALHGADDRRVVPGATIGELQAAANYWTVAAILPSDGAISIAFGVFAIGIAGDYMAPGTTRTLAMLTGAFLIASGIWLRTRPQPAGFIADGVGTSIVGAWMIVMSISADANGLLAIYGVSQIVVGLEKVVRFFPLRRAWKSKPSDGIFGIFEDLVARIEVDPKQVTFSVPFWPHANQWKGQLRTDVAIFIASDRSVIVSPREHVQVSRARKRFLHDEVRAKLSIAGQTLHGTFQVAPFEALRIWAGAPALAGLDVHPKVARKSRVFRARTVYIPFAIWLAVYMLFAAFDGGRLFAPGSDALLVFVISSAVMFTFTFVFALWQFVHWALN